MTRYNTPRDRVRKALEARRLETVLRINRRYEIAMDRIVRSDGPPRMFFWIAGWRRAMEKFEP